MNILIAADGSDCTRKATEYVASRLEWLQSCSQLHVFHVAPPITSFRARAVLGAEIVDGHYRNECEATLAPNEKILRDKNIPFQSAYVIGVIEEEIQKYVERHAIDMIVMGSHGHTPLQNLLLGSVTTKVLATTTIPILIVR